MSLRTYEIEPSASGMTLEQYLKNRLQFTRAQIRSLKFRENGLRLDGARVRVTQKLAAGMHLEIELEDPKRTSNQLIGMRGELEILYEDADLIAVWKRAGLVLHPAHGHYQDTLSNQLYAWLEQKKEPVVIRSIGRLDRDTAGIVVFAKNQIAAARLWKQKEEGIFEKEYLAVCSGCFMDTQWHKIDAPIGPMEGELMKMCVTSEGKYAVTWYQAVEQQGSNTLVRARIETGRTHQIRVHMASIGHPLTGDLLYGIPEKQEAEGMRLTAWKARLQQPFTGEWITIQKDIL